MKIIKYKLCREVNYGTDENPDINRIFIDKGLTYSEANEAIAKREAYDGIYTIEDDGEPEPVAEPTDAERIAELEAALALLLSGVTE